MKKMVIMVVALLVLCVSAAFAQEDITTPREGPAVAAPEALFGTVALFDTIDDGGNVLMEYYSGAQMEVTQVVGDGMVQVQVGVPGASVTGYMREGDLRYGALAQRRVPMCYVSLSMGEDVKVYAGRDEGAACIGVTESNGSYDIAGLAEDLWAQLAPIQGWHPEDKHGFLRVPESTQRWFMDNVSWYAVDPLEGEMTREEAYEAAVTVLFDGGYDTYGSFANLPERFRSREGLESMVVNVRLMYDVPSDSARWYVTFEDPENFDNNVTVQFLSNGDEPCVYHENG